MSILSLSVRDFATFRSTDLDVGALTSQSVRVQMLAAPINPADINTIQGQDGSKKFMFVKLLQRYSIACNVCE